MPMLPSNMLVWTSISKQSISSPDKSALANTIWVGSFVRRSCFILSIKWHGAMIVERMSIRDGATWVWIK